MCLNSLLDNVSPELENECDIISHSKYCTAVDFQEILQEANSDICIVNLNSLNLKTRFDQLKLCLADTDILSQISCITLQCIHALTNILTWYSTQYLNIP